MNLRHGLFAALCMCLSVNPLAAQDQTPTITTRLEAADGPFEAGAFQTLLAVEQLLQSFHRHGIGSGFGRFMGFTTRQLVNRQPQPRDADTFRNILSTWVDDLEEARQTLAQTDPSQAKPFVLDVTGLWFDVNGNGQLDEGEQGAHIMAQLLPRRRRGDVVPKGPLEVRFDSADQAWLTAYTHVLSAMAEGILAFDPTPVFQDLLTAEAGLADLPTIPNTYDPAEIRARIADLEAKIAITETAIVERQDLRKPLETEIQTLRDVQRTTEDDTERQALNDQMRELRRQLNSPEFDLAPLNQSQRLLRRQRRAAEAKLATDEGDPVAQRRARQLLEFGDTRNAAYALLQVLRQPPDPGRIAKFEQHLRAMLAQNRLFWQTVELETDNDREWIPNPSQTSAFGLTIDAELAESWKSVLEDAEAVLDGRLLVPHPLLPPDTGISVAAWFDDPNALDLVAWIHGRGAYPYLARGPRISPENWIVLQRLTQGNALAFSLYFN